MNKGFWRACRRFLAVLVTLTLTISHPHAANAKAKSAEDIRKFIKSKKACVFAAALFYKDVEKAAGSAVRCRETGSAKEGDFFPCLGWEVECIFNTSHNAEDGCGHGFFEMNSNSYVGVRSAVPFQGAEDYVAGEDRDEIETSDSPCTKAVVKELLNRSPSRINVLRKTESGQEGQSGLALKVIVDDFGVVNPALAVGGSKKKGPGPNVTK